MVALSKRKGSSIASSKEVRHIAILSHLSKVIEKAVLDKIVETKSELFETKMYRYGVKRSKGNLVLGTVCLTHGGIWHLFHNWVRLKLLRLLIK